MKEWMSLARLLRHGTLDPATSTSTATSHMATHPKPSITSDNSGGMSTLSLHEDGDGDRDGPDRAVAVNDNLPGESPATTAPDHSRFDRGGQPSDFVAACEDDDVFSCGGHGSATLPSKPRLTDATRNGQHQDDDDNNKNPADPVAKQPPRANRVRSPFTPANSQGVLLPPEACVFVSNLSVLRSDEQLQYACHREFERFGDCVVKVRRDRYHHPFALVQYYNTYHAHQAVTKAHELVLNGRRIRVELAQAKRSVVLVKSGGGAPTVEEARRALVGCGPIDRIYPTTHADARQFGCPEGLWIEFACYLDCKDALKHFNAPDGFYRLLNSSPPAPPFRRSPANPAAFGAARGFRGPRSTADQKSIFLGNLPDGTTEDELRTLFAEQGEIKAVNMIHKPIFGGGQNVFGFIQFGSQHEAEQAAQLEVDVRGHRIRVEPKEYSARRHTRLHIYAPVPPYSGRRYGYSPMSTPWAMHQQASGANFFQGGHTYGMPPHLSPYHTAYDLFQSPPQTDRVIRRNNMAFPASPHPMTMYSPVNLPSPHFGMDQAEQPTFGTQDMHHGNWRQ